MASFFTLPNFSSNWLCVYCKLTDNSSISVAILSRRSFEACSFELSRTLMVCSCAASSSFTIRRMISESSFPASFISLCDVGGASCTESFLVRTAVFRVNYDLVDDFFEFTMVTNALNI